MAEYELVVRARRAVTPDGIRPVAVGVRDGRIAAVAGFADASTRPPWRNSRTSRCSCPAWSTRTCT